MDVRYSTNDAARMLGISRATLYERLSLSDAGQFVLRGQEITIDYLQGGARGQGRIRIPEREINRLLQLSRVSPASTKSGRRSIRQRGPTLRHITTRPGRPNDE